MKRVFFFVLLLIAPAAILVALNACRAEDEQAAQDDPAPTDVAIPAPAPAPVGDMTTTAQRASYFVGHDLGSSLRRLGADLDIDIIMRGAKDALGGAELPFDEAQQKEIQDYLQGIATAARDKNSREFLAEHAKQPGVVTTESALQYVVIEEGDGPSPTADDTVTVHYRGMFVDGTEFDSSYRKGRPATFRVGGVIAGWTEALQLMKVGSKYRLVIPSDLAYGEKGNQVIPPNTPLVFEVELLGIGGE